MIMVLSKDIYFIFFSPFAKGWDFMDYQVTDKDLRIELSGHISSTNAAAIEQEIASIVAKHPQLPLVFDADKLEYISSAGLRILLIFGKKSTEKITLTNASRDIYEIFEQTGFTKLIDVQKKLRQVSINGCQQVGTGLSSKVYRLDADTIIKVYDQKVPFYKITREIDLAKKAFIAGLPTAISYDLVRCGEQYGVVFEMIANAVTVGDALCANNCAEFEPIMAKFAALMKLMHHTETQPKDGFPSIKGTWLDWAAGMKEFYTAEEYAQLEEMIMAVPERNTIVHCDFHAGNTLYQKGEIVVIDMADVGYAHPVFDFAAGAFHAMVRSQVNIQHSLNLSEENVLRFWQSLLRHYFAVDEDKLAHIQEIFNSFALLRGALFPMKHVQIPLETKLACVAGARKNFFPRIKQAIEHARQLKELDL
ncbi:MAG: STAS domain-containing protein [Selenomonas ruminantium]|uniref:STAS domain-containing protein n=2 Tax=Selenomonas ruminantium TaxID=971 RepID=A0A927WJH3_SELRU|nr:STAS domain-containing protein [Selenomonas ruminantium]